VLHAEGATQPKMMSVGIHPRILGHPARIAGLARFMDFVSAQPGAWITRRVDIANHWAERFRMGVAA
jgi:allantoinase